MLLYSSLGLYLVFLMNCHMPKLDVFCTNFIVMRYNTDFAIFSETACCNIISQKTIELPDHVDENANRSFSLLTA